MVDIYDFGFFDMILKHSEKRKKYIDVNQTSSKLKTLMLQRIPSIKWKESLGSGRKFL